MAKRRTGIDPLAYMGVEPSTPAQFVVDNRDPTTSDYDNFNLQTVWLNKATHAVWMLVDKSDFIATWIQFTSNVSAVNTLTGNIGGAVPAFLGNINTIGAAPYIVTGNPGTSTLTISDNGTLATIYDTDSGIAIPSGNILNIIGGSGVTVSGSGNTVTIDASLNNLEIETDSGGPVSPDMGVLQVLGGDNITTTGIAPNIVEAAVSGTTNHAVQVGNASGSLTSIGPLTTGELLIGVTGSDPNTARLTAGSGIVIDDTSTPGEITISSTGGGSGGVITTTFTSSGTWNKNPSTQWIIMNITGVGGGGGSGRRGISGSSAGGGGGPALGGVNIEGPTFQFPASATITIGAGGIGAASITTDNTDGNEGGIPGVSSFGNIFNAIPSGVTFGGQPGTSTGTLSAGGVPNVSNILSWYNAQGVGSPGNPTPISTPVTPPSHSTFQGIGGASGGTGSSAYTISTLQAANGQSWTDSSGNIIFSGGLGGIESGTIDGGNGLDASSFSFTGNNMCGTGGGGGGGQSLGLVAGNGGDGGYPGGAGGGGGGSLNGTNSGAGGDGADGIIYVYEFL